MFQRGFCAFSKDTLTSSKPSCSDRAAGHLERYVCQVLWHLCAPWFMHGKSGTSRKLLLRSHVPGCARAQRFFPHQWLPGNFLEVSWRNRRKMQLFCCSWGVRNSFCLCLRQVQFAGELFNQIISLSGLEEIGKANWSCRCRSSDCES